MNRSFVLAPHVRARACEDLLVLLDLKRDRYWALPLNFFEAPPAPETGQLTFASGAPNAALARLEARKLIEPAPHDDEPCARKKGALLLAAWLAAALWLRLGRLDIAMAGLARAKVRARSSAAPGPLIAFYERWRPWWPRSRVCLFDALSLCLFLAACGVRADLVIGVAGAPFAAHAWSEIDGKAVNEEAAPQLSYREIARA